MASEDRVARVPEGFRAARAEPLACWESLTAPLPAAPSMRGLWSAQAPIPLHATDRLTVRVRPAEGPARGVALLVPPWKLRRAGLVGGWARLLARSGWESWLVTPPHHIERAAPGARSGEGFVSLDLGRLRAVVEAQVLELRTLAAMAARRGPVGLLGLSLGALAAALAATAVEPLAFAALVAPPDLAMVLTRTNVGRRYRALAERAGSPVPGADELRTLLRPLSPAERRPCTRNLLVAAGSYDLIVPPEAPLELARVWGVTARVYPRGHLTLLFACCALRRDVEELLRASLA